MSDRINEALDADHSIVQHTVETYGAPIPGWAHSRAQTPRAKANHRYYLRRALIKSIHLRMLEEEDA